MFQTYPYARIPISQCFAEAPLLWAEVEHNIFRPWFYVTVVRVGKDLEMRTMFMVGHENSLQSLLQDQQTDWFVESVMVVTPEHVNGTGRWQLAPLEQLVVYREKGYELTLVYTVEGGLIYVTGEVHLVRDDHPGKEILFHRSMLGAPDGVK